MHESESAHARSVLSAGPGVSVPNYDIRPGFPADWGLGDDGDDKEPMRRVLLSILAAGACVAALAPVASAQPVVPRSAGAFHNSVGVDTHIVYFDTAYGDWPRIVSALDELGVTHLRDGVYANPAASWRDWNERYYEAVELAASHGIKFDFGMGQPGFRAGSLDQLIAVVRTRLRGAVDALEDPNEFDQYGGMQNWPGPLAAYDRQLYQKVTGDASLRSLPVIGPSLAGFDSPKCLGMSTDGSTSATSIRTREACRQPPRIPTRS